MSDDIHVMLDLETMGRRTNAVICSIGAVKFTLDGTFVDEFYTTVDARDCKALGLTTDPDTLAWWMKQPRSTMAALLKDAVPLKHALTLFSVWYGTTSLPTWGNGAPFDNVIMRSAYDAVGMGPPWKHWEDRCYRTMKNVIVVDPPPRDGTHHNALDDAKFQAQHLCMIFGS